jgi:DNA-binding NtrC family response regulator
VVEDEAELRQTIAESLTEQGFVVAQSPDGADALDRLKGFAYDAIVIDLRLPDADGLDVLDAAVQRYPDILAVMVTGFGGVAEAVSAMRRGAIDFLIKPFQLSQLTRILSTSLEQRRLREENADLRAQLRDRYRYDSVIGHSSAMRHVFSTLELVTPMNSTVLIQGETGTGKELIAPPPSPSRWPRPSCSATPRARSPVPSRPGWAGSNWRIAARSSSTKWR